MNLRRRLVNGLVAALVTLSLGAKAEEPPPSAGALVQTISTLDHDLFEAFNHCEDPVQLRKFGSYFAADVEFYHDNGGVTWDRKSMLANTRTYVAGKYRRELIPGSLKVYPIKGFGAIETGLHRFRQISTGECDGMAEFTHVWRFKNNRWQITRVLSFGHRDSPATASSSGTIPFEDDAAVGRWLQARGIPVLGLGLIDGGKVKAVKVYGKLHQGGTAPLDTLFNVASLTKPITTLVTLWLVSEGRWNLDEPLAHHWVDPDVNEDPNLWKLTTRHVLSHQTGFLNWRWMDPGKKLRFTFEPGTRYSYSGEGFEYLRRALEAKLGTPLETLAGQLVLDPLGMRDTRFFWGPATAESRFALGFNAKGAPYKLEKWNHANAADLLLTTVGDYSRFLVAVLEGSLLSEPIQKDMLSPQVKTKPGKTFGLGWERYDLGNGECAIAHGGADDGAQTQVFLLPGRGRGLVMFTNVDDGYKVYEPLVRHFLGSSGQRILDIEMAK